MALVGSESLNISYLKQEQNVCMYITIGIIKHILVGLSDFDLPLWRDLILEIVYI